MPKFTMINVLHSQERDLNPYLSPDEGGSDQAVSQFTSWFLPLLHELLVASDERRKKVLEQ